jgi:hypothetical protein
MKIQTLAFILELCAATSTPLTRGNPWITKVQTCGLIVELGAATNTCMVPLSPKFRLQQTFSHKYTHSGVSYNLYSGHWQQR